MRTNQRVVSEKLVGYVVRIIFVLVLVDTGKLDLLPIKVRDLL